jgi:hypothetical protein
MSITISLQNMLQEEQVKAKIKSRTRAKKIELIITRVILFLLYVGIMGACWVAIYMVNV